MILSSLPYMPIKLSITHVPVFCKNTYILGAVTMGASAIGTAINNNILKRYQKAGGNIEKSTFVKRRENCNKKNLKDD